MHRRQFLTAAGAAAGAVFATDLWSVARAQTATVGDSPYGPLGEPDANGIRLPDGFASTIVARAIEPVPGTDFEWPAFPDGAAAFAADDGGWYLAVNSEIFNEGAGSVSALRFDADGGVVDAYALVTGTQANCAGGPTPWGTWLSGEEFDGGQIWECDPTTPDSGEPRPAMGVFAHEAAAVDPDREQVYLSEDKPDGGLYRFTPDAYPDLDAGLLEIATLADDGTVTWTEVPDPSAATEPCRTQVADATPFNGGEGIWYDRDTVYLGTKGDDRVWALDTEAQTMQVVYDAAEAPDAPLRGVDNVIVEAGSGDVLVAEDGGDMEIVLITADRTVAPLLQIAGEPLPADPAPSEVTGLAFSPDGSTLYFASQRGGDPQTGISYSVTGPFRGPSMAEEATPSTTTVLEGAGPVLVDDSGEDDDNPVLPIAVGAGVVALVGAAGAAVKLRNRGTTPTDDAS